MGPSSSVTGACGHAEPRTSRSEARRQRQYALGVPPSQGFGAPGRSSRTKKRAEARGPSASEKKVNVFKPLPVVDVTYREETLPTTARDYRRDTVTLGWEDRLKARGRRRSDGGIEFGTALPRGTVLRGGDCLVVEGARVVVAVVERLEPTFLIEPRTPSEWGLFAYHIGNGHQPLMITEGALVCPDVPGVELLLEHHRIPYSRVEVAFTPSAGLVDHRHT